MATLTYQQSGVLGKTLTLAAASGGGDKVAPTERGGLLVRNAAVSSITVTIVTSGLDQYGLAIPDITFVVGAGATAVFGPFPKDLAATDGLVSITYSAVVTVTVAAVKF